MANVSYISGPTNYFYDLTNGTNNDVILLANSDRYDDGGQIIISDYGSYLDTSFHSYAVALKSNNARLVVGGNYTYLSGTNANNLSFTGYDLWRNGAVVRFDNNGEIFLTSHTGASDASTYTEMGGIEKSDDYIRISGTNTTNRDGDVYNTAVDRRVGNTTIHGIEAGIDKNSNTSNGSGLVVNGDVSGEISVAASSYLRTVTFTQTETELATDNRTVAIGIKVGGDLTITNSFRAAISASSVTDIQCSLSPVATGNSFRAVGVEAQNISCVNGQWAGMITANANGNKLLARASDGTKTQAPGSMTSNRLDAIGISALSQLQISDFVGSNNGSYNIAVQASNNVFDNDATGTSTNISTTGNRINSTAVYGGSIVLDTVDSAVVLNVDASENILRNSLNGSNANTFTNNTITAYGFESAGNITLNDNFDANITVAATGNTLTASGGPITTGSNYIRGAGIYAAGSIIAANNIDGIITVDVGDNTVSGSVGKDSNLVEGYALRADGNITVTGRINTDININSLGSSGIFSNPSQVFAIQANSITADAFSGTINADTSLNYYALGGLQVSGSTGFISSYGSQDSFDIAGDIYNVNVGVAGINALDIRISGDLCAVDNYGAMGYAVVAENYIITESLWSFYDISVNDKVELSETARVTGIIDLYRGENEFVINSGASYQGMLLASEGKMNITFIMEDIQENAPIVSTWYYDELLGMGDISLFSTSTITLNLNYAENGTYTLFQYKGTDNKDLTEYWQNRDISVVYNGAANLVRLDATGRGKYTFADSGAGVEIWYDRATNTLKATTSNVVSAEAFSTDEVEAVYDAETRTFNLSWNPVSVGGQTPRAYEVEYIVYDADGDAIGNSIVARINGTNTSMNIQSVDPGESVEWRIRYDLDGGSNVSGWSDYVKTTTDPVELGTNIDMSMTDPLVSDPDISVEEASSAVARLYWNAPVSDQPLRNYRVEYFETSDEIALTDSDYAAGISLTDKIMAAFDDPANMVYHKVVTSNEVIVSGLNNYSFIYWRLSATDVSGNQSDYVLGDSVRIYSGDTVAPSFLGDYQATVTYDVSDPENVLLNVTISWDAAVDSQSGVNKYVVLYKLTGDDWSNAKSITVYASDTNTSSGYDYSINFLAENAAHDYRIYAYDYVGNAAYIPDPFGTLPCDTTGPTFTDVNVSCTYDNTDPYDVKVNMLFSWNEAVDSESGVKEYVIEYKLSDQDWSEAVTVTVPYGQINPYGNYRYNISVTESAGQYDYRITAKDYAGNSSTPVTGSFDQADLMAPVGQFLQINAPVITVYSGVLGGDDETGEGGETGGDGTTGELPSTGITYTSASVNFTWTDTYTDESGVIYKLQFSDSAYFNTSKTFTYYTNPEGTRVDNGNGTYSVSVTIDNTTPTMPVGIFTKMNTVYWRIMAMDNAGNEPFGTIPSGNITKIWSPTNTFKFVNPTTGEKISHSGDPAQATNLVTNQYQVDGVYTGDVNFSFSVPNTDLGIRYMKINLSSKDGGDNVSLPIEYGDVKFEGSSIGGISVSDISGTLQLSDGTYTWTVSTFNAANDGTKSEAAKFIVDTTRPTTVSGIKVETLVHDVSVTWDASSDVFGIDGYQVYYRLKNASGSSSWNSASQELIRDTGMVLTGLADSDYELKIVAYDKNGNVSLDSEIIDFDVDSTADYPDALVYPFDDIPVVSGTVINTVGQGDAADCFAFEAERAGQLTLSVDSLAKYAGSKGGIKITIYAYNQSSLGYTKQVKSYSFSSVSKKDTTLLLETPVGGYYFVKVTARGKDSLVGYQLDLDYDAFPANNADDSWNTLSSAYWIEPESTVYDEWVGWGDTIDYRKLDISESGKYSIAISGVTEKVTLAVYSVSSSNKLKKVKSVSVSGKTGAAELTGLLLEAGNDYYVAVSGKTATNYEYDFTTEILFDRANKQDDTYLAAVVQDNPVVISGDSAVISNRLLIEDDYVGFGDAEDYRKLEVETPGLYTFKIDGLTASTKLTIYTVSSKGKLKSVGSVSVKPKYAGNGTYTNYSGTTKALLLTPGVEYYISVKSPNASKGDATSYDVLVSGEVFVNANQQSDDAYTSAYVQSEPVKITGELSTLNRVLLTTDEWVGYGDDTDWRKLEFEQSGNYSFAINDLSNPAKVTVYQLVNNKLKKVVSFSGKSGTATSKSVKIDADGEYYVSVEATSASKGKGTDYYLTLSGQVYVDADQADDDTIYTDYVQQRPVQISSSSSVLASTAITDPIDREWVGFGDAIDYRQVVFGQSGNYSFTASGLTENCRLRVYELSNGKLRTLATASGSKGGSISTKELVLNAGQKYYVSIEATGASKGKGTNYYLSVAGQVYTAANQVVDNNWNDAYVQSNPIKMAVTGSAAEVALPKFSPVVNEWVGAGDTIDFRKLEIADPGAYTFSLDELDAATRLTVYSLSDGVLNSIKSIVTGSSHGAIESLQLTAGNYYLAVESINGVSSSYNLRVSGTVYPLADNSDDTWEKVAGNPLLERYSNGDTIDNWVGFGDASDYFALELPQNGTVRLDVDEATATALESGELKLSLVNSRGGLIDLEQSGDHLWQSTSELYAGSEYYLGITSTDPSKYNNLYSISIA